MPNFDAALATKTRNRSGRMSANNDQPQAMSQDTLQAMENAYKTR